MRSRSSPRASTRASPSIPTPTNHMRAAPAACRSKLVSPTIHASPVPTFSSRAASRRESGAGFARGASPPPTIVSGVAPDLLTIEVVFDRLDYVTTLDGARIVNGSVRWQNDGRAHDVAADSQAYGRPLRSS